MADFDVFLSHNSKDKPVVRQIAAKLRERGYMTGPSSFPGNAGVPPARAPATPGTFEVAIGSAA